MAKNTQLDTAIQTVLDELANMSDEEFKNALQEARDGEIYKLLAYGLNPRYCIDCGAIVEALTSDKCPKCIYTGDTPNTREK